ncbi:MAG: DNA translocase FtsK 4TM domain-containing protein, partial [Planctomycetes bacterium]|nr:DNA translocase FtsK 4TM domain-containing protein [Planctomycetota bacterium]
MKKPFMRENPRQKIAEFLGIVALLILFCSCASFNISDWPSKFAWPNNSPAKNLCGPTGAFFAYYLMYYVGPGVFVILASGIWFLVAKLAGRPVKQLVFRTGGLCLLTVAASSSFYCFWPYVVYDFPIGSGGVLGVGTAEFLRSHVAAFGTFMLITVAWIVGTVLLTDRFILRVLGWVIFALGKALGMVLPAWSAARQQSEALGDIWRRLSTRQRPSLTEVDDLSFNINSDSEKSDEQPPLVKLGSTAPKEQKPDKPYVPTSYKDYILPPLDLLAEPEQGFASVQGRVVKSKAAALEKLLAEFNTNARVVAADTGPVVTMFELELAAGVKVSQISSLANDMARALGVGAVRVVAPLPGKHTIGIEVPNSEKEKVRTKDILQLAGSKPAKMEIPLFLGKDSAGEALVSDLTAMPHLLIAGTTGSGKSVCINSIIAGI